MKAEELPIGYPPWSMVYNVDVPVDTEEWKGFTHVALPYVAAPTPQQFLRTAEFTSELYLTKLRQEISDQYPGGESEESNPVEELRARKYDPPLVRFRCDTCENEWDVWIDEDGHIEDEWGVVCTADRCPRRGQPATLMEGDE